MSNKTNIWPYEAWGDPSKPCLVLLHGFMGNSQDFISFAKHFPEYYCVAFDSPGFGRNKDLAGYQPKITFERLGEEFAHSLFALNREKVVLLGYSYGARIVFATLDYLNKSEKMDLLSGVVVESSSPGLEDAEERKKRAEIEERLITRLQRDGIKEFVRFWYEDVPVFASLKRHEALRSELIQRRSTENNLLSIERALRELSPAVMPSYWHLFKNFNIPLLLLYGEEDSKYKEATLRLQSIAGENTECFGIPEAGHMPHLENPDLFVEVVRAFFEKLKYS